jgi:glycosyltransferase involved in cell wall biosynthesis
LIEFNVKKVAILTAFNPDSFKGGIETFILNLKAILTERNINVDTHYMLPEPTLSVSPFPIKSLRGKIPETLRNCFMLGRAFSKIEKDYDFVISNNFYGLGYFAPKVKSFNIYHSVHAAYADALKGKISDSDYRDLKYFFGHLGDRMGGRHKTKIAVSQTVKGELRKYYGFKKITVVNHGIDTNFFDKIEETNTLRKKWDIPSDAPVGIFVARWEIGKGIDVMEEIIKLHHNIIWLLAVGPSDCPLKEYDNIRVIKNADKEALRELYSISDFMLLPSYYEGFGLAIIEAMACELPVICTEVGVARDLIGVDALRPLILPNLDKTGLVREISDRISFLKKGMFDRNVIATAGRSIIEKDYSLDIWKNKMSTVLGLR